MVPGWLSCQNTCKFRTNMYDIVSLANVLAAAVADLSQKRPILQKCLQCIR